MNALLSANSAQKYNGAVMGSMKSSLIKSGLFHVGVLAALSIGLPYMDTKPLNISAPISVEIVDVSELTTTKKVAPPTKPKEPEKPAEPAQKKEAAPKVTAEQPPDLSKPKPPEVETNEDLPEPVVPPPPLKREEIKKPDPPKPKPDVTKRAKPKPKEDDFQSLLKNLTPDAADRTEKQDNPDPDSESDTGQIARLSDQLSISEQDMLRRQLGTCWNIMAGAKNAEDLAVEIRVVMNRDRTVNRASILDKGRYNQDRHFRAAADAAIRALNNPKCSPLRLPPDKYEQWKTFIISFDPRDML